MQFIPLESEAQLNDLFSATDYRVILKHNTTCPISKGVVERLQDKDEHVQGINAVYILDLLAHREISNAIAGRSGVPHQSPQLLLVKDGRCIYHEWGFDISMKAMADSLNVK